MAKEKVLSKNIDKVIHHISDLADKWLTEGEDYKDLFKKSNSSDGVIINLIDKMEMLTLQAGAVLENKFGIKNCGEDLYCFMLGSALLDHVLEKKIIEKHGHVCCVDKTHFLIGKKFQELVDKYNKI
jgi:hypothetical protein